MSAGPRRERPRGQNRYRSGPDKPSSRGMGRLPDEAWAVVAELLRERGWLGLIPAVAILHLSVKELYELEGDPCDPCAFHLGGLGAELRLREKDATEVRVCQAALRALPVPAERIGAHVGATLRGPITTELRRRLRRTHPWVENCYLSVELLRRRGEEEVVAAHAAFPERIRGYARSAYATAGQVRPQLSLETAEALSVETASLWAEVECRLSERAKAALRALGDRRPEVRR